MNRASSDKRYLLPSSVTPTVVAPAHNTVLIINQSINQSFGMAPPSDVEGRLTTRYGN